MIKTALKFIILLFAVSFLGVGALIFFSNSKDGEDCWVADSNIQIDRKFIESKSYDLIYNISGWHEKVATLKLYVQPVNFDLCGNESHAPLFTQPLSSLGGMHPSEFRVDMVKGAIGVKYQQTGVALPVDKIPTLWITD